MRRATCSAVAFLGVAAGAWASPLTPGNLVVVQAQANGRLTGLGAATRLREFATGTNNFNGNELVFASDGTGLVLRGNDVIDGQLQRSPDGRYLSMVGYNTGLDGDVFAAGRSVALIDQSFTATRFNNNAHAGQQVRSAITNDGVHFFISGNFQGVVSLDTTGGNTGVAGYSTGPGNMRVAQFGANGADVLVSGTAPSTSLYVNTIPPGGGALAAFVTGAAGVSPNDFHFVSPSLLYVAVSGNANGLERWELSNSVWSMTYRIIGSGLDSIAVTTDASGNNLIYATTVIGAPFAGNQLVSIADTGPASVFNILATAGSATAFRGVEFAPIPAPATGLIMSVAGVAGTRRRRA